MRGTNTVMIALLPVGCALLLHGCTGMIHQPEEQNAREDQFLIQSLTLAGTTRNDCAVVVDELADQDGLDDRNWQVGFALDGAAVVDSLPADDGGEQSYVLGVKATRSSDGEVFYRKITITFYE